MGPSAVRRVLHPIVLQSTLMHTDGHLNPTLLLMTCYKSCVSVRWRHVPYPFANNQIAVTRNQKRSCRFSTSQWTARRCVSGRYNDAQFWSDRKGHTASATFSFPAALGPPNLLFTSSNTASLLPPDGAPPIPNNAFIRTAD
jgi:hypothetical protein